MSLCVHQNRVNNGAANIASNGGYAPLINGFRKRMIDSLGTITCNGVSTPPSRSSFTFSRMF